MAKIIIFTDLDGTLLDHSTYSYDAARPALTKAKETNTPIIPVTSKTFAENEAILKEIGLWKSAPVVVENGGAIYIPKNYFSFDVNEELPHFAKASWDDFYEIKLGKPYEEVRAIMKEAAETAGLEIRAIGDMSAEEFQREVNFETIEEAHRAQEREYQEGFKILVPKEQMKEAQAKIKAEIEKRGFFMSIGGRFCQIMGSKLARQNRSTSRERIVQKRQMLRLGGAKIRSVEILTQLLRKKFGDIHTIGLGDAQADIEFCEHCDEGFIVKNPKKTVGAEVESDKIHLIEEEGPTGWNKAVLEVLKNQD